MPSQRPKVVIYSDDTTIKKLQFIADKESRKVSNYCDILLHKHIAEYELKHGEIVINEEQP